MVELKPSEAGYRNPGDSPGAAEHRPATGNPANPTEAKHPVAGMHAFRHHQCIPGREQRPVAIIQHRTEFQSAIFAQLSSTIILLLNWEPERPMVPP